MSLEKAAWRRRDAIASKPSLLELTVLGDAAQFPSRLIVNYVAEVKVKPAKRIAQRIARVFIDERAAGANMLALRLFFEYVIGSDHRMAGAPMYAQAATNARRLINLIRLASREPHL